MSDKFTSAKTASLTERDRKGTKWKPLEPPNSTGSNQADKISLQTHIFSWKQKHDSRGTIKSPNYRNENQEGLFPGFET